MATPIIVTFYSFRGGVGRSMAMFNAGWVLARTGSRVLLVDFDLEAPGLTRLIARQDLFAQHAGSALGVADIILQLLDTPDEWAFHAGKPLPVDLAPFLRELKVPQPTLAGLPQGRLAMIPAGTEGYEGHLARIHSEHFTTLHQAFAARFREVLLGSGGFDYILVDARTGYSDEAYIAARYLCDHLVVLTGLNDENIEGTGRFLSKVSAWSEAESRPRSVVLLASPVPEHEEELKARRFDQAKQRLAELSGTRPDFALQLPYHPRLSLYEELLAKDFPESGLGRAYQQLGGILRRMAQDSYLDWAQRAAEAMSRDDTEAALAAVLRAAAIDLAQAAILFFQVGDKGQRIGQYGKARTAFRQALAICRQTVDRRAIGIALHNLAWVDRLQGRYAEARRGFEEALAIYRELGDRRGVSVTLHSLAELDRLQGRYAEARRGFEEALAIYRELGDRRGVSVTLHSLAELDRLQGRYAEARRGFEAALAIDRELGDPREIAVSQLCFEMTRTLEDPTSGLEPLRAAAGEARQSVDPTVASRSYQRLAEVLCQRGQLAEACAELSAGIQFAEEHGLLGYLAEMRAERALAAADAGDLPQAAADAREALAFFEAQEVAHPHLARLRELAAAK
jgi:tetratricopeptide (TPR) repeat protein